MQVTPAWIEGCAQALGAMSCAEFGTKVPAACAQPRGSLADGHSCLFDGQCSGGSCQSSPLQVGGNAGCGTCGEAPRTSGCGSASDCPGDQVCSNITIDPTGRAEGGTCIEPLGAGATCSGDECGGGLNCATSTGGAAVCTAPRAVGQGCNPSSGALCEPDLLCANDTCQTPQYIFVGGARALGGAQVCVGGNCVNGTCVGHLALGATCAPAGAGATCVAGTSCSNGTCMNPLATFTCN